MKLLSKSMIILKKLNFGLKVRLKSRICVEWVYLKSYSVHSSLISLRVIKIQSSILRKKEKLQSTKIF